MPKKPVDLLSPKNDFVFKQIFGDAKRPEPLKAFLQATLGLPDNEFTLLRIVDPNMNPEFESDKHCILDVRVRTGSGKEVDIEIQVQPSQGLYNRIQCYTGKMLTNQVKAGDDYSEMAQVITIVIADFVMWQRGRKYYHHRFCLYEPERKFEYPNSMAIHTLELPKLPEQADGTPLWNWLKFISSETRAEFESLAGKDRTMASAYARLEKLSADEAARLVADSRDKAMSDHASRMNESRREGLAEGMLKGRKKGRLEGRKEGRKEGLAKGRQAEKAEIIRQMLWANVPVAEIAKWTNSPLPEIERLAEKIK